LVRLVDKSMLTARGYFLVRPPARSETPAVPILRRRLFNACSTAAGL
jgi:LysR family transcriptional regulator, glycine cleavage system transcriptional activator